MIGRIIKDIIDPLFAMSPEWLEHYGGYTVPLTLKTAGSEPVEQVFPFSCDYAVVECQEDERFLVPNKNKLSIAYWEENGEAQQVDESLFVPGDDALHFEQDMRLVFWYNYGKMGHASPSHLRASIFNALNTTLDGFMKKNTQDPHIKLIALWLDFVSMSEAGDEDVFSKYTYFPTYDALFTKPYDYFYLDYKFSWIIWKACIPAPVLNDSLIC